MKTKFMSALLLAGLLLMSCHYQPQEDVENTNRALIPIPQAVEWREGSYELTPQSSFRLSQSNESMQKLVAFFNAKIAPATGFTIPIEEDGDIQLKLIEDKSKGKEYYNLEASSEGVVIEAVAEAGLFYGLQTLLQLLPNEIKAVESVQAKPRWIIPSVAIEDYPKFEWRGLMLDVSRHWFTKEEVKRYIDQLAEYKMNVFHWHLTDDQGWRIEIKSLPRLTEVGAWRAPRVGQWWQREPQKEGEKASYGGYYTHEDVREVVAYAAERNVRVIPEIDVPGHSLAALVAYPQLACLEAPTTVGVGNKFYGMDENSLCVGNPYTYEFMDQVLTEVVELFPDEYVHIGGDECFKGFWSKCPKCKQCLSENQLKNTHELQSYFIKRMEKLLKSKGKKLIGWDEIHEGGLAPEATVMSWRGMQGGIDAAKAGHHVIMTPNNHCYLDLYQGDRKVEPDTYSMCRLIDSYNFQPVPEGVSSEMILGGQGNLWSESVPTFRHAEYMTWPRGWALAEVLWKGPEKEWSGFVSRVEQHFDRADFSQINYARSMYNAIVEPFVSEDIVYIEVDTEIDDLDIYYTFDNTLPDTFTPKYEKPLTIPKDATWFQVVTYRDGKPVGKTITYTIEELRSMASANKRVSHGNLNL